MQIGISLSLSNPGGAAAWSPSDLGADLLAFWDAERADLITASGGLISSWRDTVSGYDLTQATGAARPTLSATSFNGRAGATFDGSDDTLGLLPSPFPSGANPSEIWVLTDQTALVADNTTRALFAYGNGGSVSRRVFRVVLSGVNRAQAQIGNGTGTDNPNNAAVDFSGRHVMRTRITATAAQVDMDGAAGVSVATVPSTATTLVAMGSVGTGGIYFQGVINSALVTKPLSDVQAAQLTTFLKARGGIA